MSPIQTIVVYIFSIILALMISTTLAFCLAKVIIKYIKTRRNNNGRK